jgi:hypothetical protein
MTHARQGKALASERDRTDDSVVQKWIFGLEGRMRSLNLLNGF